MTDELQDILPSESAAPPDAPPRAAEPEDPADRSLNESLRISFGVLKLVMLALAIWFVFSGVRRVPEGAVAVRLHFGRVAGDPGEQVLKPRWYFAWPDPIDRVVIVPTTSRRLDLDSAFWFDLKKEDRALTIEELAVKGYGGPLRPGETGSLLTGDQNLVHGRWSINWKVQPGEVINFIRNVSDDTTPVTDSEDESKPPRMMLDAEAFIAQVAERTLVHLVAQTPADEYLRGKIDRERAKRMLQKALDDLNAGIRIEQVQLSQPTYPMDVRPAYLALTQAESKKAEQIEKARQEYQKIVNEVAGPAYEQLLGAIEEFERVRRPLDEARRQAAEARQLALQKPSASNQVAYEKLQEKVEQVRNAHREAIAQADRRIAGLLESERTSGRVSRIIKEALAYKRTISERILAEASVFDSYYQVFKDNPQLRRITVERLWEDARQEILAGDVESFFLPPDVNELWLDVSRDPRVRSERYRRAQQEKIDRRNGGEGGNP